jgi:hypothetical protein
MNRLAVLVLAAVILAPAAHPGDAQLWRIGVADDSSQEFTDYQTADPELVTIPAGTSQLPGSGISKGLRASSNPSCEIRFTLATLPAFGAQFSFKLLNAEKSGAQLAVFANDAMAGLIQLWGTNGSKSPYAWKRTYRLYIPRNLLHTGLNVLRLRSLRPLWSDASVDKHLWWEWDYLQLDALAAAAREPIHGSITYLGTTMKNSANGFAVDDDTLHIAPIAFSWMGIAYSGNTIRADFWYDVAKLQPRRAEYLTLLRDLNLSVDVDFISGSHFKLDADGHVPQRVSDDLKRFFETHGALFQYYELGNEPCMFGGDYQATLALARLVDALKPAHVKLTACGWAYGGGKGTPKNWDADVDNRRAVEDLCQATDGHSYGYSYADDRGGSFIENLSTCRGVADGWPKEYINTETGTNNWHSEENGTHFASTQPKAQAFDRIMRAHVAVVDRTMQHAAIFDDFGLFAAPNWQDLGALTALAGADGPTGDTRLKTFRRLALAYATHGTPLAYTFPDPSQIKDRLIYVRAVDTSGLAALPGSGATSNRLLLNLVNFDHVPQHVTVVVTLPAKGTYSGMRIGAGATWAEAHRQVELAADPAVTLDEQLGAGEAIQFILTPPGAATPRSP